MKQLIFGVLKNGFVKLTKNRDKVENSLSCDY